MLAGPDKNAISGLLRVRLSLVLTTTADFSLSTSYKDRELIKETNPNPISQLPILHWVSS